MINFKGFVTVAVLGYGAYYASQNFNLTLIPLSKDEAISIIQKTQPERAAQYRLSAHNKCSRVGGSVWKDGVFACEIEFTSKNGSEQPFVQKVLFEKPNGKWIMKSR